MQSEISNAVFSRMKIRKAQIRAKIILDLQDTIQRMREQYREADFYTKQLLERDARTLKRQLSVNLGLYRKELLENGVSEDLVETLI